MQGFSSVHFDLNAPSYHGACSSPWGGGGGSISCPTTSHPASHLVTQPPNRLATILCWALHFCILLFAFALKIT